MAECCVLTVNSLRLWDTAGRTVARIDGVNSPSPNERDGRFRRYEWVAPVEPGRGWTVVWGRDLETAGVPVLRRTRTAPVVTTFAGLPANVFSWALGGAEGTGVVAAAERDAVPLACTGTVSGAFVLSWLLNLALSPFGAMSNPADTRFFVVDGDVLVVAGVPIAATGAWPPDLTERLNALTDVRHCAAGLVAAADGWAGWDLVPVESLPDAAVHQFLALAGFDDIDVRRLTPAAARDVVQLTRLLLEHLPLADTGAWWRAGEPSPLELVVARDLPGAQAAVADLLHRPPDNYVAVGKER